MKERIAALLEKYTPGKECHAFCIHCKMRREFRKELTDLLDVPDVANVSMAATADNAGVQVRP